MDTGAKNLLITGEPGIGKSTVIRKLITELRPFKPVGFYTAEIRNNGVRVGFQAISLDGRRRNLAHIDMRSHLMVGKYRVGVYGFEKFLNAIDLTGNDGRIVIIDEIGKMECMSRRFREVVCEILEQDRIVVATIAKEGFGLIDNIRKRDDITLLEMNRRNREEMVGKVLRKIQQLRFS
ncbi:MAG: nucleoside-triphosphatase [Candidatus Zixiibacteriota bacterium]